MRFLNFNKSQMSSLEYLLPLVIFLLYFLLFFLKKEIWFSKGIDLIDADSRELFITSKNLYINFDLVKHPLYFIWHIPLFNILDFLRIKYINSLAFIYSLYPAISSFIIIKIFKRFNYFNLISILLLAILFTSYSLFSSFPLPETYSFSFLFASLVLLNLSYLKLDNSNLLLLGVEIAFLALCNLSAFLIFPPVLILLSFYINHNLKKLSLFLGSFLITFLFPFLIMTFMGSNNLIGATNDYASKYYELSNLTSLKIWFDVFIGIFPGSIFNTNYALTPSFRLNFINLLFVFVSYWFVIYKNKFNDNFVFTNSLKYFLILYVIFVVYFHPPSIYLYSSLPLLVFFMLLNNKINYLVRNLAQSKLILLSLILIVIASFVFTSNVFSLKKYLNEIDEKPEIKIDSYKPKGYQYYFFNKS